jgi:predicted TIM-barrel fold metal-dependent hydrolase
MQGSFRVVDCNRHVVEPLDLWSKNLGEPFRDQVNVQVDSGGSQVVVSGKVVTRLTGNLRSHPSYLKAFDAAVTGGFSAELNLKDMDSEGIDVALLFPTTGLYVCWSDDIDPVLAGALGVAYNNWLHEYCEIDPSRLKGVALLPLQDPDAAAEELRRSVETLYFAGGLMRPNPIFGRRLYDHAYDPLYREAEALGVPIFITGTVGTVLPEMGVDRFPSPFGRKAVGDPFEMWFAMLSLIGYDVFERFPDLKVGFIGAGCGWLPYWLDRIEEHWETGHGSDAPGLHSPRLQFESHGFVAADPWENTLPEVIQESGLAVLVWGSRYPEPEVQHYFPHELDPVMNSSRLSAEEKASILSNNASRFLHIS